MMSCCIIRWSIWHSLNILSKLRPLLLFSVIHHSLFRLLLRDHICALLSGPIFCQYSASWTSFNVWKYFLFMTFYRIRICDSNTCLRPLVVYLFCITLFELGFVWTRLSSWLMLHSHDVIRIHSSIHSQYWLLNAVFRKILPTHVLHLQLSFMDWFWTFIVFRKHHRNEHVVHRCFVVSLTSTVD